ncbi:hypothetical protein EPN42_04765 [bacterium]|nr:MAG: hypothetical protein EPN42_04765 [bacterium]
MIIYELGRKVAPLLGPQLERRGPFAPGDRVAVTVPLVNERQVPLERVQVRFCADHPEVRFDPESVDIPLVGGGEQLRVETSLLVPQLSSAIESVRVWAVLHNQVVGSLETAHAEVRIESRAALRADCDETDLIITNVGTAAARVHIDGDRTLPPDWTTERMNIQPGGELRLSLPIEPLGVLRCIEETSGERTVVIDRRSGAQPPRLSTRGEARGPQSGVRVGDLLPIAIEVLNSGGPAYDAEITLNLPGGVTLLSGYTTRDDVPLLDEDIVRRGRQVDIRLGCIQAQEHTVVRGAARVEQLTTEADSLAFAGEVRAAETSDQLRFGTRVLRAPALSGHGTYFAPLREDEQGLIHTTLTITNAHGEPVDGALALTAHGAQIETVTREGRSLELGADAVDYGTLVEIGSIAARSRVSMTIIASRIPLASDVGFEARMVVGGRTLPLAEVHQELVAEPRVSLTLRPQREARVRVGQPCLLEVSLANHGSDPLRGARLRPVVPEGVRMRLPVKEEGGWYPLAGALAPLGGRTGFPLLVELSEPPYGNAIEVAIEVDSDNAPLVRSEAVVIATPSSPTLILSEPELREVGKRGLVEVRVRVANRSDGVARDVWLAVRAEDRPVPFTATLDAHSVDERGRGGSMLSEGMPLGDLPPGTQRDVAWYAAPSGPSYYTKITVRGEPGIQRVVDGGIELADQAWFTSEPLPARPIDENVPIAGVTAAAPDPFQKALDQSPDRALETADERRALGSGEEAGTRAEADALAPTRGIEPSAPALTMGSPSLSTEEPAQPLARPIDEALTVAQHSSSPVDTLVAFFDKVGMPSGEPSQTDEAAGEVSSVASEETTHDTDVAAAPATQIAESGAEATAHREVEESAPLEDSDLEDGESPATPPPPELAPIDPVVERPDAFGLSFGFSIVEMVRGTVPSDIWRTALAQAVVLRLLGPREPAVLARRDTVVQYAPQLLSEGITDGEVRAWFARILAGWCGGELGPRADEAALAALQGYTVPSPYVGAFDDYLAELEDTYPLRTPGAYLDALESASVPGVVDALAQLVKAVRP